MVNIDQILFIINRVNNSVLITQTKGIETSEISHQFFTSIRIDANGILNNCFKFLLQFRSQFGNILFGLLSKTDFVKH